MCGLVKKVCVCVWYGEGACVWYGEGACWQEEGSEKCGVEEEKYEEQKFGSAQGQQ